MRKKILKLTALTLSGLLLAQPMQAYAHSSKAGTASSEAGGWERLNRQALTGYALSAVLSGAFKNDSNLKNPKNIHAALELPTSEEILANGYPVNGNGETYGPELPDGPGPDLIPATNADGIIGYVKATDLYGEPLANVSLEKAANIRSKPLPRYMNLYLQDGETVIGTFDRTGGQ